MAYIVPNKWLICAEMSSPLRMLEGMVVFQDLSVASVIYQSIYLLIHLSMHINICACVCVFVYS